jgi:integrase
MPRKTNRVVRFTKQVVSEFIPPKKDRIEWWDEDTPNLVCRVASSGLKTFCWVGRDGVKFKREKIGNFPQMAVAAARDEARRLTGLASQGQPIQSRPRAKRAEWTLQDLFDWYMENHSKPHKRTWQWDERQFANRFLPWANRPLSQISRADVQTLFLTVGKECGPYAGNKVVELLGHMYRLGAELRPEKVTCPDPTKGIKRFPREERERFLDAKELPLFLEAVEKLSRETTRDFMKLALWTGARRSNVAGMRWEDVSIETATWIIRSEVSKNKKPMNIPLSPEAIEILKRRKKTAVGPWVLTGQGPTGHFTCPRDAMKQVLKMSGLKDVRVHDLRRTLGSWMAVNAPLQVIGKQLGHSSLKSTSVYARLNLDPVRAAVNEATAAMSQVQKPTKKKAK